MLVVHAGNRTDAAGVRPGAERFPEGQVAHVAARVRRLLATLRPTLVVSAPAAGADLVVLAEAQRAGVPVHVLLALPEVQFEERSVADRGPEWVARFRSVLAAARADEHSTVDERSEASGQGWWRAANAELVALAVRLSAPQPPLAFTIRPVGGEQPPSGTDHFVALAEAAGLVVVTLDPRPSAPGGSTMVVG